MTPDLEDLLERRLPSAIHRDDAALASAGASDAEVAATKDAIVAVGLAATHREAPSGALRERLMASRQRPGKYGVFADRVARLFDLPIADAEALMERIEQPDTFAKFLIDGVEMIPVQAGPRCASAIATLVRVQPGVRFPDHVHRGGETMLVLDGGFVEPGGGEEVWRGDEIHRGDGTEHALLGLPGTPCIVAVVIEGYADFR